MNGSEKAPEPELTSKIPFKAEKKGFRFREVTVERDRDGARERQRRHIIGVPIVLIGSRPIVGFDNGKIDKLPGIKR